METLQLHVVLTIVGAVAAFFASWGLLRGQVSELEKRVAKLEAQNEKTAETLNDAKSKLEKAASRISDIAELKQTAVSREVFAIRMTSQDEAMRQQTDIMNDIRTELRNGLDRKVSVSSMAAAFEPEAPKAPALPPMRPRAPSRPIR